MWNSEISQCIKMRTNVNFNLIWYLSKMVNSRDLKGFAWLLLYVKRGKEGKKINWISDQPCIALRPIFNPEIPIISFQTTLWVSAARQYQENQQWKLGRSVDLGLFFVSHPIWKEQTAWQLQDSTRNSTQRLSELWFLDIFSRVCLNFLNDFHDFQ